MIERTGSVRVVRWRTLRIWSVTTAAIAVLGVPAGLVWGMTAPAVREVIVNGEPLLADPEGQQLIGIDGRFALISAIAGLLCGIAAYVAGGRDNDVTLLLALAAGGVLAGLIAWRVGHQMGLDGYRDAVRAARTGNTVKSPPDLRARGVLMSWPLLAVTTYGVLEVLVARLARGGTTLDEPRGETTASPMDAKH